METNKEIPTAQEMMCDYLDPHDFIKKGAYEAVIKLMIDFNNLHLTKQAEFIAENAETKDIGGYNSHYVIDKQSIINAGEEYKNSVK